MVVEVDSVWRIVFTTIKYDHGSPLSVQVQLKQQQMAITGTAAHSVLAPTPVATDLTALTNTWSSMAGHQQSWLPGGNTQDPAAIAHLWSQYGAMTTPSVGGWGSATMGQMHPGSTYVPSRLGGANAAGAFVTAPLSQQPGTYGHAQWPS